MTNNVVSMVDRLKLDDAVRPFLSMLGSADALSALLGEFLPTLTKDQQRAILTVAAFRIMGGHLPASIELLARLPTMTGMHRESIGAAFHTLVNADYLLIDSSEPGYSRFVWPPLERLLLMSTPKPA